MNIAQSEDRDTWARGARKAASQLGRKLVPAMPAPEPEDDQVKRDAYQLARENVHKPWARRYLKNIARGFYAK